MISIFFGSIGSLHFLTSLAAERKMKQYEAMQDEWWNTSGTLWISLGSLQNFAKLVDKNTGQKTTLPSKSHRTLEVDVRKCRSVPFLLASALQRTKANKSSYKEIAQLQKAQTFQPIKLIWGVQASTASREVAEPWCFQPLNLNNINM